MSAALSNPNPPLSRIALTHRAGPAFPLHTMLHGFALHANRRVEICAHGPRVVAARVRPGDGDPAGRVEDVRLEARADRLVVGCSCPARSLGLSTCKHSWAVLLEADLLCALDDLRTSLRPLYVDAIDIPASDGKPLEKAGERILKAKKTAPVTRPTRDAAPSEGSPATRTAPDGGSAIEPNPSPPPGEPRKETKKTDEAKAAAPARRIASTDVRSDADAKMKRRGCGPGDVERRSDAVAAKTAATPPTLDGGKKTRSSAAPLANQPPPRPSASERVRPRSIAKVKPAPPKAPAKRRPSASKGARGLRR